MAEICSENNVGLFNSILWVATMLTLISGNIMGFYVIEYLNLSIFYIILTAVSFSSTIYYFCFWMKPIAQPVLPKPILVQTFDVEYPPQASLDS
jgi:hypothetical protein